MDSITLTDRIKHSRSLDFGTIFGDAIELFKKTWLQGFVFTLLTMVMAILTLLIIYIPLFGMISLSDYNDYGYGAYPEIPWVTMMPFFLLFVLAMIFVNTIIFAMTAGFFKIVRKLDAGEEASGGDMFMYVKGKYLGKAFVLSLAMIGIELLATLLCFLPLLYVMVPVGFFAVVFAFNPEFSSSEIIRISFKLGNKKWLLSFGLIIIGGLLAEIVGLLLCGIGIFFTASFIYLPLYLIYKETVGFKETKTSPGFLEG